MSSRREGRDLASVSQKLAPIFVGLGGWGSPPPARTMNHEAWYPEEGGDALEKAPA